MTLITTSRLFGKMLTLSHEKHNYKLMVTSFSVTVKAATLFYSYLGVVRLFHLLNKGNQVLYI